jgi:hypothetical protein
MFYSHKNWQKKFLSIRILKQFASILDLLLQTLDRIFVILDSLAPYAVVLLYQMPREQELQFTYQHKIFLSCEMDNIIIQTHNFDKWTKEQEIKH